MANERNDTRTRKGESTGSEAPQASSIDFNILATFSVHFFAPWNLLHVHEHRKLKLLTVRAMVQTREEEAYSSNSTARKLESVSRNTTEKCWDGASKVWLLWTNNETRSFNKLHKQLQKCHKRTAKHFKKNTNETTTKYKQLQKIQTWCCSPQEKSKEEVGKYATAWAACSPWKT